MTNQFVNYLNSMNNAASNTINALAESQVKNPYFMQIKVERKLGKYIADSIRSGNNSTYILTGHAGDGKTSILVQVLNELGLLSPGEGLEIEKQYDNLYYVKDMSELDIERQEKLLEKVLNSPQNNSSAILVSNTGPLLNSFNRLINSRKLAAGHEFTEDDRIALETALLNQLDNNKDEIITVEGYSFFLINIARVDNVSLAKEILRKIVNENLWTPCEQCAVIGYCPIYNNMQCVKTYFDRVSVFVENFYRYLYENDKRMTIRQMLSQISFAFTGNLTCADIKATLKKPFYNYNFANLFFGFKGMNEFENATQIKGIEQIRVLNLDAIALDNDYTLFVNQDFSCFPPNIKIIIEDVFNTLSKRFYSINLSGEPEPEIREKETLMRKSVRRFYLVYSSYDNLGAVENVFNQIYGEAYSEYINFIVKPCQSIVAKRKMQSILFNALYINNTGFMPKGDTLYLTLRREDDAFQNVLLVLGKVDKEKIEIVQKKISSRFEDIDEKYELYVKVSETDIFKLTLPLITYFKSIINGSIASNNNPTLTHGVAKLNTMLHNTYKFSNSDTEMRILINTTKEQLNKRYTFDEDTLIFE